MRFKLNSIDTAISALVAGMAFFFLSCAQGPLVSDGPAQVMVFDNYFKEAEAAYKAGKFKEAKQYYNLYLETEPEGEEAPTSLYRIAEIDYSNADYIESLDGYQRLLTTSPDYPEAAFIRFSIVDIYYRLHEFEESNQKAFEWIDLYPEHPLMGEIFFKIGRNYNELGQASDSFHWWLKAEVSEADGYSLGYDGEYISSNISDLIENASINDLVNMAGYGDEKYCPAIYHRLALISLENENNNDAKRYAMALIRSTSEQQWVSKGREILESSFGLAAEGISAEIRRGVIGCLLPLSGDYASYGQDALNGIQLGMDLYNGTIEGEPLELVIKDTAGNPETAALEVDDLFFNEKAAAIIGPLTSKSAIAAAKRAQELGIPIITLTQKSGITDAGDMVFRNFLSPEKEVEALLDEAIKKMGIVRFGVLYPETSYGKFYMNLFWDRVEKMGGRVTAIESYTPDETDYAVQIKKMTGLYYPRPDSVVKMLEQIKSIKSEEDVAEEIRQMTEGAESEDEELAGDPEEVDEPEDEEPEAIIDFDAVFIPDHYKRVELIAPQFPFYNVFNVPFLGTSLWRSPQLIETTGDYVQNAIFPAGFFSDGTSKEVQDFVNAYRAVFSADPGMLAANGYDTIRFLKGLIEIGGIKTRDDFIKGLAQYYLADGVTGKISFDESGEVEKKPVLLTVFGKKIQQVPE